LGMPEIWIKLWKDALYSVLKHPQSLGEYEQRAAGQNLTVWANFYKAAQKKHAFEKLNSSLMIGVMAKNAEQVPFQGLVAENFLLQFWPLVVSVFRPQVMDREGKTSYRGYVVAIPDILDLDSFCQEFPYAIQQLRADITGFLPSDAIIAIPQEGALAYAANLVQAQLSGASLYQFSTASVEVYYLEKRDKSVHLLTQASLVVSVELVREYHQFRETVKNKILKAQWLANKLAQHPWYTQFESVFSKYPQQWFVVDSQYTEPDAWIGKQFAKGVSQLWSQLQQVERLSRMEATPADEIQGEAIELTIFNLVREYVEAKTTAKTAIQKPKLKKGDPYWKAPQTYQEEGQKICSNTFYRLRACKSRVDFMRYFTDTLCSVPHGLSKEKYQFIASALRDEEQ